MSTLHLTHDPVPDDRQDGVITLFHLPELPEHLATSSV